MKKLTVFAHSRDATLLVDTLVRLKCVEIETHPVSDEENDSWGLLSLEEERSALEKEIADIDQALRIIAPYSERKKSLFRHPASVDKKSFVQNGLEQKTREHVKRILELQKLLDSARAEQTLLTNTNHTLEPWANYSFKLNFSGTKNTVVILGTVPAMVNYPGLKKDLMDVPAYVETVSLDRSARYCVFYCCKEDEESLLERLVSVGFIRASFAEADTFPRTALQNNQTQLVKLDAGCIKCEDKIRSEATKQDAIETLRDIVNGRLTIVNQKSLLQEDGSCVMLSGWVPNLAEAKVISELEKMSCAYETNDPEPGDNPPVLLLNNPYSSTFEWVIGMYSYPKYGRFDPTFIMSIFYFLIFGLMFADVGYGLILALAGIGGAYWLKPKESMKRFLLMFGYCGISCMVMGAVFGGWFGDLPFAVMTNMLHMPDAKVAVPFFNGMWFNPLDDPMTFLIVSLGVGALHLIAGMAVKFYILCKDGQVLSAFFDVGSWWVLFAGIGIVFFQKTAGLIVIACGILALILTQGRAEKTIGKKLFKGIGSLYDIISYASDLLSYSRILALGLVAGVIAQVVNLITLMGATGVIGFFVMIIVLAVGHVMNLAINVLGTFVHTSRLQYIEFFGKFFEDGGRPFKPAAIENKYTTDD